MPTIVPKRIHFSVHIRDDVPHNAVVSCWRSHLDQFYIYKIFFTRSVRVFHLIGIKSLFLSFDYSLYTNFLHASHCQATLLAIREVHKKLVPGIHESYARSMMSAALGAAGLKDGGCLTLFGGTFSFPVSIICIALVYQWVCNLDHFLSLLAGSFPLQILSFLLSDHTARFYFDRLHLTHSPLFSTGELGCSILSLNKTNIDFVHRDHMLS